MKYTDSQLCKIYGEMPDGGIYDDMRYFIELGRADAFREGMVAAAGIARGAVNGIVGHVTTEQAILAAAAELAKVPEVCVWGPHNTQDWHRAGCNGESFQLRTLMQFCPYCGKTISVREG